MTKNTKLRIAMVAPPFGETGGPEVVVKNLTEALVKKGIDVTLFAPGDWSTTAKHVHTLPKSLWNMKNFKNQTDIERRNLIIISQHCVLKYQKEFDIIHLHSQRYAASVSQLSEKPCVLTMHNQIKKSDYAQLKKAGVYPVALSNSRKKGLRGVCAIIENGLNVENIKYSLAKGSYLMALGRINEHKGFDLAIKIARLAKKKLLIFGRIGNSEERQAYFKKNIQPFLGNSIIYKGEATREKVFSYLRNAEGLLFPIKSRLSIVPLVAIEALACGTPIIGSKINNTSIPFDISSVAYLSDDMKDLVFAAKNAQQFDRKKCREFAEKYFDSSIMAEKYLSLYQKIITARSANK
jgi:glycosyltransferase involved in cell wall biosynthesis